MYLPEQRPATHQAMVLPRSPRAALSLGRRSRPILQNHQTQIVSPKPGLRFSPQRAQYTSQRPDRDESSEDEDDPETSQWFRFSESKWIRDEAGDLVTVNLYFAGLYVYAKYFQKPASPGEDDSSEEGSSEDGFLEDSFPGAVLYEEVSLNEGGEKYYYACLDRSWRSLLCSLVCCWSGL